MARKNTQHYSRKKIHDIATEYANCPLSYSHDYFERTYGISKSMFYHVLERAVIEGIVEDITVTKMQTKASENSEIKAGTAGAIRSKKHYDYLILRRNNYILLAKEAQKLIERYIKTTVSKKEFAKQEYITTALLNKTIYNAIINNWVNDESVEQLKQKSLAKLSNKTVIDFWDSLLSIRQKNKEMEQ